MSETLRIGLVGAGGNMRLRHIPGLRALDGVELVAVCNRRPASTEAAAREFQIPRTFARWQDLVADANIDAVVIGTWPYLHAPITIAALTAGKHVLCEARMAMNAAEARDMLDASLAAPKLVAQIVPSPFGLKGDLTMRRLISGGFLGELREVQVVGIGGALADPSALLSWRQDAALSGVNMLALGILHETLCRWVPAPVRVLAQAHAFVAQRVDPESGLRRAVGTPDSVQVLSNLTGGVRCTYHLSGAVPVGGRMDIALYGSDGMLEYDFNADRITGASRRDGGAVSEIPIPEPEAGGWSVEADFVASIRNGARVRLTDFATGVAYMEFTEAVARSAELGRAVELPGPAA
jgi:predicted dehydrogenase